MTGHPFERYQRAKQLLVADPVLTDGQLRRLNAWHAQLPARTVELETRAKNRSSSRLVTFRALQPALLARHTPAQLAHVAGTAAIRHALDLSEVGWTNEAHLSASVLKPDGLLERPGRWVLVEYDSGTYSARTVRRKMLAFREAGRVVWGVTIPLRAARIKRRYPWAHVLVVDWWSDPESERRPSD